METTTQNGKISSDFQLDVKNWMGHVNPFLTHCPLRELIIPGTHDSATYGIKSDSDFTPKKEWPSKMLGILKMFPKIVARSCKTQGVSIGDQLSLGIRYIDLRIIRKGENKFATFHGMMYSVDLDDILVEIDDFIKLHEKEIIIIDINAFAEFTKKTHFIELEQKFVYKFKNKIATNKLKPTSTLVHFWKQGKQIILIWNHKKIEILEHYSNSFWSNDMIHSIYAGKDSRPDNFSKVLKKVIYDEIRSPSKLFSIQGVVPVNSHNKKDLHKLAGAVMPELKKLIKTTWEDSHKGVLHKHSLNIITADFFNEFPDFIRELIMYNFINR
jgi:hypothetical protein